MTSIQERIDELQKQLIAKQMAEAEQDRKKTIVSGSIEQLEEFCNLSDKILDKPSSGAEARPAPRARPGETLKEVFKNRLDPTYQLYERYVPLRPGHPGCAFGFDDWYQFKTLRMNKQHPNWRRHRQAPTPVELEVMKNEWVRELENRVYSTTSAGDMYINETLKCILGIVKKQQKEINWLKSKLA